jgi:ribose transport system substrate-binding protein
MYARLKVTRALVGAVGLAFLIGACSSSGSSTASSGATGSATSSGDQGVEQAKQFLTGYTQTPTSIGPLTPLASKPPTGKHLALLTNGLPVGQQVGIAAKEAAAALGWTLTSINVGTTTATAVSAFEAALAMHPYAILDNGEPAALFPTQLAQAKAEGIPYFESNTGDPPTSGVTGIIGGEAYSELVGKILAAEFVVDSNGHGNAVFVSLPVFTVIVQIENAFIPAVKQWCPGCSVKVLDQQLTQVGTQTPSNVVAFLNANPSVKYLVFSIGDLYLGVPAALRTAGITDAKVLMNDPEESDIEAIAAGSELAAVTYSTDVEGWRLVDLAAREATGTDLTPAFNVLFPTQLLTKENAADATIEGGYYVAPADYQSQFKKLWNVSS